ncbi:hypothetical protein T492DRAFT_345503 [Pavlovales sp. CCMP2436]|nr:hypothetical protein T492DRAFT_345503 [Pavlovales sp. CCMP2436]
MAPWTIPIGSFRSGAHASTGSAVRSGPCASRSPGNRRKLAPEASISRNGCACTRSVRPPGKAPVSAAMKDRYTHVGAAPLGDWETFTGPDIFIDIYTHTHRDTYTYITELGCSAR